MPVDVKLYIMDTIHSNMYLCQMRDQTCIWAHKSIPEHTHSLVLYSAELVAAIF